MDKKLIAFVSFLAVAAGCKTYNAETGKVEYTGFGKAWNATVEGTRSAFNGAVDGATAGYTQGTDTNELSWVDRTWGGTKGLVGGMFKGAGEGISSGAKMSPEEYEKLQQDRAAADAAAKAAYAKALSEAQAEKSTR